MSVRQQYTKELRNSTNYLPTWLPTIHVSPGDIGRITDYQYTQVSTLKDMKIDYATSKDTAHADFEYSSARSVSSIVKLAGQVPPPGSVFGEAEAGISFTFSRENAVVFRAAGCRSSRIENQLELGNAILARYQSGDWAEDLVVVTEVVYATSATVLISTAANADIALKATGNIQAASFHVANAEANFQVIRETNIGTKLIAQSGLTPLIRTAGIRKRLFRPEEFRNVPQGSPGERIVLTDVDYADYANG